MLFTALKDSHSDLRGLAALGAGKKDIGYMDRRLFLDDASLGILLVRLHMFFDNVDLLDKDLMLIPVDRKDATFFALLLAGDNNHGIFFLYS